jgi:hypothetical protein
MVLSGCNSFSIVVQLSGLHGWPVDVVILKRKDSTRYCKNIKGWNLFYFET